MGSVSAGIAGDYGRKANEVLADSGGGTDALAG